MKTENKLISPPAERIVTQRIRVGDDPAQGLSFRFLTHEQYSDVGMRIRLLMSRCVIILSLQGRGPTNDILHQK